MVRHASLLTALLLVACSSSAPIESAPPPAGPETGEQPPAEEAPTPTPSNLTFERSDVAIDPGRDHHTTMVIETASGPWLYVVGGTDAWEIMHHDVQRARIGKDGKLGAFESAGSLPDPRAGHCMVKKGDRLYLFGGVVGVRASAPSKTSVVLTLDADGKVVSSAPGPELPMAVLHLACELVGDHVYALGGRGESNKSTTLSARTTIAADGSASAFEDLTPLVPDRSHHATFVRGKNLYVLGGITGAPTGSNSKNRKDAVVAEIAADGKLGPWFAAGALPTSISVSSAQLHEDFVYVAGGLEEDGFTNKIRRATFNEDGTLTEFTTLKATLPDPRGHVHQTPMYGAFIYSVGGKNDDNESLGTIDVGRFEAPVE
jgi:hypothetical protein